MIKTIDDLFDVAYGQKAYHNKEPLKQGKTRAIETRKDNIDFFKR